MKQETIDYLYALRQDLLANSHSINELQTWLSKLYPKGSYVKIDKDKWEIVEPE